MGRYIYQENEKEGFTYKFAFGDQSSSFGEVMEEILSESEDNYITRFISDSGEIVRITIDNPKKMQELLNKYVEGNKEKTEEEMDDWSYGRTKFGDSYWNKVMIKKLIKSGVTNKKRELSFYVEY